MTPRALRLGDTITTAEDLDALPRGATVVIDDAEGSLVAVKDGWRWHTVGMDPLPSADLWDLSRDLEEGGPTPVVLAHLPGHPPRPEREVKAEALREATMGWQLGGWHADLPRTADRPALILGMAQRATEWFRAEADRIARGDD